MPGDLASAFAPRRARTGPGPDRDKPAGSPAPATDADPEATDGRATRPDQSISRIPSDGARSPRRRTCAGLGTARSLSLGLARASDGCCSVHCTPHHQSTMHRFPMSMTWAS